MWMFQFVAIYNYDGKGATPLFVACENGHLECGKELVKHKADYNCTRKLDDVTPLMMASHNGHESIVRWLLSFADIDVFHKSKVDWNAFFCATAAVNTNIASYLYSYVMNECLYDNAHAQVVEFVNQASVDGCTPLMATLLFDSAAGDPLQMIQFLVEKCKVEVDSKSKDGQTAADLAKQYGRDDIALYLSKQSLPVE